MIKRERERERERSEVDFGDSDSGRSYGGKYVDLRPRATSFWIKVGCVRPVEINSLSL